MSAAALRTFADFTAAYASGRDTPVEATERALARRDAELVAVERNPVDAVWEDRPAPSSAPAEAHPLEFAGVASDEKRAAVAEWLLAENHKGERLDAVVISALIRATR